MIIVSWKKLIVAVPVFSVLMAIVYMKIKSDINLLKNPLLWYNTRSSMRNRTIDNNYFFMEMEDSADDYEYELEEDEQEQMTNEGVPESADDDDWKTVLFWTPWFGTVWSGRFHHGSPEELKELGCPSWRCNFTSNRQFIEKADAVVFSSTMVNPGNVPKYRAPHQRWVWVCVESPLASPAKISHRKLTKYANFSRAFNWTMTYHSSSDVSAFYGYFLSIGQNAMPLRPNFMSAQPSTMEKYFESYSKNVTLKDIMGDSWRSFVQRPKLVAWMTSHCGTHSKREQYALELSKYVELVRYGKCVKNICLPKSEQCWEETLGKNYLFYLSFENALCDEYITEKLYYALKHNLVPIVWGGGDYARFLPPGSYINGRHYHPKDLAELLLKLQKDPVAYGRYHVWRGFWTAHVRGSFCELCHKLHTDKTTKYWNDIKAWRIKTSKCESTGRNLFKDGSGNWKKVIKGP